MYNVALIVAAGRGFRFKMLDQNSSPKQYYKISNEYILSITIKKFLNNINIDIVRVVIHKDDIDLYNLVIKNFKSNKKLLDPIYGADTRQGSVLNGLQSLASYNIHKILIHDAVRPFISSDLIDKTIEKIMPGVAVMVASKIYNTVRRVNNSRSETLDRSHLYSIETPQGFIFNEIFKAHEKFIDFDFSDDIALLEQTNNIEIIESYNTNNKITIMSDIPKIKKYRNSVGIGFDAHKFQNSDKEVCIKIGGIDIPFNKKIIAHSDGDVILHALSDAIFGATCTGDIGMHFPPNDDKWKNADSSLFIKYALNIINKKKAVINNLDITLIAEKPKLSKYRNSIQAKIADLLEININQVNIKATTTEKMGFAGREEGIAAQAVISLELLIT